MKRKLQKEWLRSYLWSGPSLLLIALVVVFPILYTFYISLTNMNVYHWFDFTIIGLENYIRALFVFDSGFLSALLVTVLWTVVNMVLQLVIAFVLASLLNIQNLRFRKLYKTLLMFPWAMPGYRGSLLPRYDFYHWLMPKTLYYQNKFLHYMKRYLSMLYIEKNYLRVQELSMDLLSIDMYESEVHYYLIKAMLMSGSKTLSQIYFRQAEPYLTDEHMQEVKTLFTSCRT